MAVSLMMSTKARQNRISSCSCRAGSIASMSTGISSSRITGASSVSQWLASRGRRVALRVDSGRNIVLDLDKPTALNDGDAVKLEDGRLVLIKAAAQRLLEI